MQNESFPMLAPLVGGSVLISFRVTVPGNPGLPKFGFGASYGPLLSSRTAPYSLWQCSRAENRTAGFAIPGSIVGGIGLVLLFKILTGHWESDSILDGHIMSLVQHLHHGLVRRR